MESYYGAKRISEALRGKVHMQPAVLLLLLLLALFCTTAVEVQEPDVPLIALKVSSHSDQGSHLYPET